MKKNSKIRNENCIVKERQRKCTDLVCLCIFVILVVIASSFYLYAFIQGSVTNIEADYDGNGLFCGIGKGQPDEYLTHKYLYFSNLDFENNK